MKKISKLQGFFFLISMFLPQCSALLAYNSDFLPSEENGNIVKTYYCSGWEKVREGIQAPIVMAGGKKIPEDKALQQTYDAIKSGADGVDMGRNKFQAEYPVGMIKAVMAIVHDGLGPVEAYALYQELEYNSQQLESAR